MAHLLEEAKNVGIFIVCLTLTLIVFMLISTLGDGEENITPEEASANQYVEDTYGTGALYPPKPKPPIRYASKQQPIDNNPKIDNYPRYVNPKRFGQNELKTIVVAANRNKCGGDLFLILLAIRKAENGRPGLEFGVLHPRAINTNLDTQAGWAAATVVKNYQRWLNSDKSLNFITFLGNRYCPTTGNLSAAERRLNGNWIGNVTKWYKIFRIEHEKTVSS